MGLDGRIDFLQDNQICKASNFRWKVLVRPGLPIMVLQIPRRRKAIPLAQNVTKFHHLQKLKKGHVKRLC